MASVAIIFTRMIVVGVLVIPLTRVESLPMASPEVGRFDARTVLLPALDQGPYYPAEIDDVAILPVPSMNDRPIEMEAKDGTPERSAQDRKGEEIVSAEEENRDDLETAAGTNVLRPLFVYRQQVAYRERVKKAGRRAAPNF